jgi:polygalacturonase
LAERSIRVEDIEIAPNLVLPSIANRADKLLSFDTEGAVTTQSAADLLTGSVLGANYTKASHTGDGTIVAFSTTEAAGSKNNIQVYIDGVYQNKDTFSINGSTLTFSEAPPLNSAIEFIVGNAVTSLTTDPDVVAYNQGGAGAQDRTLTSKLQETVSVKDFGAVGDGVTDDTAAVISAITAAVASAPATLVFPAGVYKCSTPLGDYFASDLTLEGQDATLDFTSVPVSPAVTILSFSGSIAAGASLTSDAARGQKTVAVVSATFTAGDFVKITSDAIWDSGRTSSKYGELNFIETVPDGSSVTTTMDLMSFYGNAANAKIQKITPVRNINIKGLKLVGPAGNDTHKGIVITNGINCTVEGIQSYDMDAIHVQLFDCTFCRVFNCYFQESNAATTGYGTSFVDATQDCSATNNVYTDVRHSLSTNNSSAGGITRRILFANNIVTDSALATGGTGGDAIDTHAAAEDISIIGNTVNASSGTGINVECRTATVTGNIISNVQANGITHQNYTDITGWTNISDNTIRDVFGGYCIAVVPNTGSFSTCTITGNNIDQSEVTGIRTRQGSFQFVNVNISGNSVRMTGTGTGAAVDLDTALSGVVSGNTVQAPAVGIDVNEVQNVTIAGNSVRLTTTTGSATGYAIRLDNSYGCVVSGNTLYNDSNLTAANATRFTNTVTYSGVFGNVGSKFTASTKFLLGTGTGNAAANNIEGV